MEITTVDRPTKIQRVFDYMRSGAPLTAGMARKRFGVNNLAAEASRIRYSGYAVYANQRHAGNGTTVTEYEMGRPSREVVALGMKAKALGYTLESL